MWDAFPYLGNAVSAALTFISYRANGCLFPLSTPLIGDLNPTGQPLPLETFFWEIISY